MLLISTRVLPSVRGYAQIEPAIFAAGGQAGLSRMAAELPASYEAHGVPGPMAISLRNGASAPLLRVG